MNRSYTILIFGPVSKQQLESMESEEGVNVTQPEALTSEAATAEYQGAREGKMADQKKVPRDIAVLREGDKIIVPEALDYDDVILALRRRKEADEIEVAINHEFDMTPPEGGLALLRSLQDLFGFVSARGTPGWFGPKPPVFLTIEIAPGETEEIPWGRLQVPNISGFLEPTIRWAKGIPLFSLTGLVKGKHKPEVDRVAAHIRARTDSIYRGRAIRAQFPDPDEVTSAADYFPKFMSLPNIPDTSLIFDARTEAVIQDTLFTPIECVDACRADGLQLKRGVLLEGPFGVGKSLTSTITARKCKEHGWTFIYLDNVKHFPKAFEFAKRYQPCVIYAEDLDQGLPDPNERDEEVNSILNVIDGVDTKGLEIISVFTTNTIGTITQAMLRPGRLDTVVEVRPPDAHAAQRLVRLFAAPRLRKDEDLTEVGRVLSGRIPAMIREVVERSRLGAIRRKAMTGSDTLEITAADILSAAAGMEAHMRLLEPSKEDKRSEREKASDIIATAIRDVAKVRQLANGSHEPSGPTIHLPESDIPALTSQTV